MVAFWRPVSWVALDAVWTGSRARYVDSPDGSYVAGAVSMRMRYLGKYPLLEDDSVRADAETGVNLRGAWKPSRFTLYAEALNIFDEDGKDIVYYYGANVAGLDPPGEQVEGRVSRAEEPRTFRVGVKYAF